jgi:hypothetical protein
VNEHAATGSAMRGIFLALFLLSAFSAGAELLLLGHTESLWQWLPLLLIALSFLALTLHAAIRHAASVRVFQLIMFLFIGSGFVGIWQHYQARAEFKLETNPALSGMNLLWEALTGAAVPPVLAPGIMVQMGLLGLAYTFRHPALVKSTQSNAPANTGE